MNSIFSAPLLLGLLLLAAIASKSSSQQPFKCAVPATCGALIDYVSPNDTSLNSIKTLFSVKNLRSILGANNFPTSTSPNFSVAAKQTIRIPFPCTCSNGTGISNKRPIYTVQSGDGLYHIAAEVFSNLVTYPEIARVNNVTDVNLIEVGQRLWIPLPCSCDDVDGSKVVHYGHVVAAGGTLDAIAEEYGTTKSTLMSLNGIANESSLLAGEVLDVPLRACNSSVRTDSLDYPLLLPNGTYFYTANSCVRCKCDSRNNWTLQCEPSGLKPANFSWDTCPSLQCAGSDNLSLSNTTSSGCNQTTCAYAGYSNRTIFTTLAVESICAASSQVPGNHGTKIDHSSFNFLFITFHFLLLCVYLL